MLCTWLCTACSNLDWFGYPAVAGCVSQTCAVTSEAVTTRHGMPRDLVRPAASQRWRCSRLLARMALRHTRPLHFEAMNGRSPCQPRPAPARAGWATWRSGRPPHASRPMRTTAVWCDASLCCYSVALQAPRPGRRSWKARARLPHSSPRGRAPVLLCRGGRGGRRHAALRGRARRP